MEKNYHSEAASFNEAGRVCLEEGDLQGALDYFSRALDLLDNTNDRTMQAGLLNNMGHVQVALKRFDDAINSFQKAAGTHKILGNSIEFGDQLGNIGSVYRDNGEYDEALRYNRDALDVFQEQSFKVGIADQYTNIAYIYVMKAQPAIAVLWYENAATIYGEVGEVEKARMTEENIQRLR
jgi:tetratricopeptide (TPR) repeat protein